MKKQDDEQTVAAEGIELVQGSYWRAKRAIKEKGASKPYIPKDRVLMLQSIRDVDQEAHTIILRGHPTEFARGYTKVEHRFLIADFLDAFTPLTDVEAKAVRAGELRDVQFQVQQIEERIALAASNPQVMQKDVDAGIEKWEKEQEVKPGSTANIAPPTSMEGLMRLGLSEDELSQKKLALTRVAKVAELQGAWMTKQTEALGQTIERMTPYFAETAAAALAKTQDIRFKIDRMYRGIESLDLYVGKNVTVETICKGASADPDIPLSIKQAKLFMDEEFSVFADIGEEFDYRDQNEFFQYLAKHPALADQIFPTLRSVICMAVTRHEKFYTGDAITNYQMNERNKAVFLLVRDGENVHKVWSAVETHLHAGRLFPTRAEIDKIFTERKWGWSDDADNIEQINFMDVRYTDKLSEHEAVALHYKRFLILLAGLDHRLDLFGPFYREPKGLNFISQAFVAKHMDMIADDERIELQLPGEVRPDFAAWIESRNEYLRSGSRVMGFWRHCMTRRSAPGVFRKESQWDRSDPGRQYHPVDPFSVKVTFRDGKDIMVKVPVKGELVTEFKDREFEASVNLSITDDEDRGTFSFLVLDAVKPDDLDYYIHSRIERENHVAYIRLFKHAIAYLREEAKGEAKPRAAMIQALADGGIAHGDDAAEIVDKAVIAYRSAKRGAMLPPVADKDLLDQMYEIAKGERRIEQAEHYAMDHHLKPLRLTISGKSVLRLYCAPRPDERDDRLYPHAWVKCLTLYAQQKGLGLSNETWKCLPVKDASETVLKEWPGVEEWAGQTSPITLAEKKRWIAILDESRNSEAAKILGPLTEGEWQLRFELWKRERRRVQENTRRRVVMNLGCAIPIGLTYRKPDPHSIDRKPTVRVLCIGTTEMAYLLYQAAPTKKQRAEVDYEYSNVYEKKDSAHERIREHPDKRFFIYTVTLDVLDKSPGYGITEELGNFSRLRHEAVTDLDEDIKDEEKEWKKNGRDIQYILGKGWAGLKLL